jgi:hypothetical protein
VGVGVLSLSSWIAQFNVRTRMHKKLKGCILKNEFSVALEIFNKSRSKAIPVTGREGP